MSTPPSPPPWSDQDTGPLPPLPPQPPPWEEPQPPSWDASAPSPEAQIPLPEAPTPPKWDGPAPPGSIYDTGLANTPLPPQPVLPPLPPAREGPRPPWEMSAPPWDRAVPAPVDNAQLSTAFVSNLRAEIRQLEGYFSRQTRRFRLYGVTTLVCAAAVPVTVAAGAWSWLVALLGSMAAISGSVQTLYRFQDSGLSAMSLANRLEAELVRYETGTAPYVGGPHGANFNNLVDRVTTIREEASASFHGVWSTANIKG